MRKSYTEKVDSRLASQILRRVQETFLFASGLGEFTGESAVSLTDFKQKINNISLQCLEFHLYPRTPDFESWIRETLGDDYLADQISQIDKSIIGDELRNTLISLLERRLEYLKLIALTKVKGIGLKYSKKLITSGINSVHELAKKNPVDLAIRVGVSEKIASRWVQSAVNSI
jgi:hypothetical protein